ncbi:MAG: hypothetical protein UX85_C0008G0028 [Candidatus Beckwithbacteria bacterium GW2011_GWB1_47_15]|uniref:DUF35 domain-containing protein n=1 Tax=Candidatus Beckwithbacteria bacterium GW2011_GWB1_47_15 TaxID=1618371 RepID=A0A0G1RTN7_9BACT|nr:MAG: hypothetical protein UY43_C0001G1157 [Candidatus Beckwithbacteria bacterium GW2011_GWC1_49_16]KKU34851.1 MAG: hypothetical protein UX50_C0010G0020 [Candidatus Beckwithbacteria bacterium GW2011_GWA1_46_30]KKU60654.1 MAG: hypothetical protein UX85_C0008G0028 [Candidatus Beckwithbacteria bacterium GW2011_GWB1_47_15]KKU72687.1 MAG: hypothetical protein UX97_C0001G0557 [Candidatus Beckwithbacteria bacterium GW2011_GWA2_47_25]KKW02889.1 MAG: hypothetical protein UY37_C0010G0027 [Candidatus Be
MKAVSVWRRQKTNYQNLGIVGKVVSKTRIIEAPQGFVGPYWVVMVAAPLRSESFEGQERVVGQWADVVEPKIGMKVVGVLRRIGEAGSSGVIEYGVKWKQL